MKFEDAILEVELSALADGKSHDEAMDEILEIAKSADDTIGNYSYLREINIEAYSTLHDDLNQSLEENVMFKTGTIVFAITTVLLGIYICL